MRPLDQDLRLKNDSRICFQFKWSFKINRYDVINETFEKKNNQANCDRYFPLYSSSSSSRKV